MSSSANSTGLRIPTSARQIAFHQLLVAAWKTYLIDALHETLGHVDPAAVKLELTIHVPADVLMLLAATGMRDEHVFPVPSVLRHSPTLVGYYRLLLGASQKSFYSPATGLSRFRSMEVRGSLNAAQGAALPEFCTAMCQELAEMVRQIVPTITYRDLSELPLLTLGAQLQGANNKIIGREATDGVFLTIAEIVQPYVEERTSTTLLVRNASGRAVHIVLASDPDISLIEESDGVRRNKVAIEIKGGTDKSNAFNRTGKPAMRDSATFGRSARRLASITRSLRQARPPPDPGSRSPMCWAGMARIGRSSAAG